MESNQNSSAFGGTLNKLVCLGYAAIRAKHNLPPLTKTYFSYPQKNQNEQYFYFATLFSWLTKTKEYGQFDDPNTSSLHIATVIKKLGIPFDHSNTKLSLGHGNAVLYVLERVTDLAISDYKFKPTIHKNEYVEDAEVDDSAEVLDEYEDATHPIDDSGDVYVNPNKPKNEPPILAKNNTDSPADWRLEVERASSHLHVKVKPARTWRSHAENGAMLLQETERIMHSTNDSFAFVHDELSKSLDQITSREKFINDQLAPLIDEYRVASTEFSSLNLDMNNYDIKIQDLSMQLSNLSDQVDEVKSKTDVIGSGMTNSKPLMDIRACLKNLKAEIKTMALSSELRITSLYHSGTKRPTLF